MNEPINKPSYIPTGLPLVSIGLPLNGILRLYNQFPRCYEDIYQMTLQLPEIAAMKFNAVWINPIQETGKLLHPLSNDPLGKGRDKRAYSGSLYAIRDTEKFDDAFSINKVDNTKNNTEDLLAIKTYTKTARSCGLTPIFDLVLNQVALDSDVYKAHPEWFIPPCWNVYLKDEMDIKNINLSELKGNAIILLGKDENRTVYFVKKAGKGKNELIQAEAGGFLNTNIKLTKDQLSKLIPKNYGFVNRNKINGDILTKLIIETTQKVDLPPNRSKHFGPYCCEFDFHNPEVRNKIIEYFKKQIYKYIVEYGFVGVRVDAAKHIPPEIQKELYEYVNKLCLNNHNVKAIIFAEIFLNPKHEKLQDVSQKLSKLGITHVTNFLHWGKLLKEYREWTQLGDNFYGNRWEKPWAHNGLDKTLGELFLLRNITQSKDGPPLGGTIGFPGCHDTNSLYDSTLEAMAIRAVEVKHRFSHSITSYHDLVKFEKEKLKLLSPENISVYMKELIAVMALTSDAGWYLLSGDEFGHAGRKWVFDFYNPCENGKYSFCNGWGGEFDLRSYICGINQILSLLPKPDPNYWIQHVVLNNKPELMIAIRHNGDGYSKTPEVVIINCSNNCIELSLEDIQEVSKIAGYHENKGSEQRNKAEDCIRLAFNTGNIFCMGNIEYKGLNTDKNVKIIKTDFFPQSLLSSYIKIVESNPENPMVHYNLALYSHSQKHTELMLKSLKDCYEVCLKTKLSSPEILFKLGNIYKDINQTEECLSCFSAAVKFFPDNPIACYYMGVGYEFGNRNEDAKKLYIQAFELLIKKPLISIEPYLEISKKLIAYELQSEGLFCLTTAAEIFSNCDNPIVHYNLGQAAYEMKNLDLARNEFIGSYKLFMNHPRTTIKQLQILQRALRNISCFDEALECNKKIFLMKPDLLPSVLYNEGVINMRRGNNEQAKSLLFKSFGLFKSKESSKPKKFQKLANAFKEIDSKDLENECLKEGSRRKSS